MLCETQAEAVEVGREVFVWLLDTEREKLAETVAVGHWVDEAEGEPDAVGAEGVLLKLVVRESEAVGEAVEEEVGEKAELAEMLLLLVLTLFTPNTTYPAVIVGERERDCVGSKEAEAAPDLLLLGLGEVLGESVSVSDALGDVESLGLRVTEEEEVPMRLRLPVREIEREGEEV